MTTNQNDPTGKEIFGRSWQMAVLTAWRILGRTQDTESCFRSHGGGASLSARAAIFMIGGGAIRVIATRRAIDRLRKRAREETKFILSEWKYIPLAPGPSPRPSCTNGASEWTSEGHR